jgi:peptidoglycan hydrolase-like amidase
MAELRAQAVASRSFAPHRRRRRQRLRPLRRHPQPGLRGLESETAAQQRSGGIDPRPGGRLRRQGSPRRSSRPARAATPRASRTSSAAGDPYWSGVPDPYDYYCPLHTWTLRFTGPRSAPASPPPRRSACSAVVITKRGASPRIIAAKLYGSGGVTIVTGSELESALGGYDTWMSFQKVTAG